MAFIVCVLANFSQGVELCALPECEKTSLESETSADKMSSTKKAELEEARAFLQGVPVEPPEEILKWLKSKKIFEEPPIEDFSGQEEPAIELSLNQAITTTLANQWDIEIAESEVKKQYGEWQKAAGSFDPLLESSLRNQWLIDPQQIGFRTNKNGNVTDLKVAVEKLTRIGTHFTLQTTIDRTHDPSLIFVEPYNRFTQSTFSFEVNQPLLRRLIYNQESVDETVASLEFDAAQYLCVQTMAEQVLNTVVAYWDLVFAEKVVMINEDAERILEGLASASTRLVEKNSLAASELNEQIAELARNRRDLIGAKQDVYARFNALLFQMGERRCEFSEYIPHMFLDNFIAPKGPIENWDLNCLLNQAYDHRGDLIAARIRIQEANLLLRLACNNLLPALDVVMGVEYINSTINQKARSFFASYYPDTAERDVSAELRLSLPIWNDRAKGERRQRYEEQTQAFLRENKLWSNIYSDLASTLRAEIELVKEMEYANKAADWYEIALRDEILRTKAGYGSLFIVIDFENRFRLTLLERANVQRQFAQNTARLLFLTGTLVMINLNTQEICIDPFNYEHLWVKK